MPKFPRKLPKTDRIRYSGYIYAEVLKSLVLLSYLQERPLYEVMETAFMNYLESHQLHVELDNIERS